MGIKKVKAIELIFDWNLWPRHKAEVLDQTNLRQLREALQAGNRFPPIIVSDDMRIVDGFHRTRAILDVLGEEGKIDAEIRHYENEAAMFLEAMALNNQGLKLSPLDRAFSFLKARKMKIPVPAIAIALGMPEEKLKTFIAKRSAKTQDGEIIPLPGGAINLAGKVLTESQEHFARHTGGCVPLMYARMFLNALRADALTLDETALNLIREMVEECEKVLRDAA